MKARVLTLELTFKNALKAFYENPINDLKTK